MVDKQNQLSSIATALILIAVLCLLYFDIQTRVDGSKSFDSDTDGNEKMFARYNDGTTADTETGVTTRSGARCLTFEETFDKLVESSNNVFVSMPAKAAGTSMKAFTNKCVGEYGNDNSFNAGPGSKLRDDIFLKGLTLPKIITFHLTHDYHMIDLAQNLPREALIVYIHRNENDRLLSAIRHIILTRVCIKKVLKLDSAKIEGSRCVIGEKDLIENVIKPKIEETRLGSSELMTCGFYNAIEDNFPRMVFVHYKQVDKLQKVLAKYHCPELLDQPVHHNVAAEKEEGLQTIVKLVKGGKEVELDEWLEAKRDFLEFMFELKETDRDATTCQGKTRSMEDDLFSCEDKVLQITRDTLF